MKKILFILVSLLCLNLGAQTKNSSPFSLFVGKYKITDRKCEVIIGDSSKIPFFENDSSAETIEIDKFLWRNNEIQYFFRIENHGVNVTAGNAGGYQKTSVSYIEGIAEAKIENPHPSLSNTNNPFLDSMERRIVTYSIGENEEGELFASKKYEFFSKETTSSEQKLVNSSNCHYLLSK